MSDPHGGEVGLPGEAVAEAAPPAARPLLTIGIPAFNEELSLTRCLGSALSNVEELADPAQVEIVLVDDGSTDRTAALSSELIGERGRVLRQPNRGRAATRRVILDSARGEYVLMLDAHVELAPGVLSGWLEAGRPEPLSGDLTFELNSPYALFWDTLTTFGWRDYLTNRRAVSFGPEDFDRFPKGTGMFLARRSTWLTAYADSGLEEAADRSTASDDTRLLRALVERHPISLRPEFRAVYFPPRSRLAQFLSNARYRGTTFVDSYWESPSIVGRTVRGLPVAGGLGLIALGVTARSSPRAAAGLVVLTGLTPSLGVASMAVSVGLPPRQAAVSAALAPAFSVAFGAGLIRGYLARASFGRSTTRIHSNEES